MLFIKYVCRVPLRMSEEALLIGDEAIHAEDPYCFYDNMDGLIPTADVEQRALEKLAGMRHHSGEHNRQHILEGQRMPSTSNGEGGTVTPPHKNGDAIEVKMD
jgi:ammonium transporter, Amt family